MNDYYKLKDSRTLINLANAFAIESQTRSRYLFYAETAQRGGQKVLEKLFLEISENESGHSKIFYNYLADGVNNSVIEPVVQVDISLGSIADNLAAASQSEYETWSALYPSYGHIARQEGFETIANSFFAIASIEKEHDRCFRKYLERHNTITLYLSDRETEWKCLNCGHLHIGQAAPDICPACLHPKEYYEQVCVVELPNPTGPVSALYDIHKPFL
jgi:rubrerythrin